MRTVTRQQITLSCHNGRDEVQVQIMARVYGGLAFHKGIGRSKGYTLTHLQSSISVATEVHLPIAVQEQALEDIASLMDWTLSYDEICCIWVHNNAVKEAVFSRLRRLH